MSIGDGILRLRKYKNLTQHQLAEATGKTQQCISQYERGVSVPNVEWIIDVADRYAVSIDFIVGHSVKSEEDILSVDALYLLEGFNALKMDERRLVLEIIKVLRNARSNAGGERCE